MNFLNYNIVGHVEKRYLEAGWLMKKGFLTDCRYLKWDLLGVCRADLMGVSFTLSMPTLERFIGV
jgi:ABC-type transporter Mla MlaB component